MFYTTTDQVIKLKNVKCSKKTLAVINNTVVIKLNDAKVSEWKVLMAWRTQSIGVIMPFLYSSYKQKPAQFHWETNLVCRNGSSLNIGCQCEQDYKTLSTKIGRKCVIAKYLAILVLRLVHITISYF